MDQKQKLVSVILASYNHAQYIGKMLKSLINQTYKKIELIILDDGSIDNTYEVLKKFEDELGDRFENLVIIFKENEGVCKTINKGLQLSKGEFYFLAASDDIILPEFIEKHVEYLEKNPDFICSYSDGINVETEDIELDNYDDGTLFSKTFPFKEGNLRSHVLEKDFIVEIPTIAFFYRREVLNKIGYYDENIAFEDIDMFYRISREYEIGMIEEVLCLHRLHSYNSGRNCNLIINGITQLYEKYEKDNVYTSDEKNKILTFLLLYKELYLRKIFLKDKKYIKYNFGKKNIVWGASVGGKNFIKENLDIEVDFFVDLDYVNKKVLGFEIKPLEVLRGQSENYYVFIASSNKFYEEIKLKLDEFGYKYQRNYC